MGTRSIRFGSQLTFDEDKEKDIIDTIDTLNSSHKMGQFMSNLIRLAFDNPEILRVGADGLEKQAMLQQVESSGMSVSRQRFMFGVTSEISDMKKKVDDVYNMVFKLYTLALMNKHLEIENKSDNSLRATFVLERQLRQLQDSLGVNISDAVYESDKVADVHVRAEDCLEYIIETYDGIIDEMKQAIAVGQQPQVVVQQAVGNTGVAGNNMIVGSTEAMRSVETVGNTGAVETQAVVNNASTANTSTSTAVQTETPPEEEMIDFGDTDDILDAMNFFDD